MKSQYKNLEYQNEQLHEEMKQLKRIPVEENNHQTQPVVYQDIKIERMMVDKYEMNNNIAQLGVKELSGSMNIGATYGKGIIPEDLAMDFKKSMEDFRSDKPEASDHEFQEKEATEEKSQEHHHEEDVTEIKIEED